MPCHDPFENILKNKLRKSKKENIYFYSFLIMKIAYINFSIIIDCQWFVTSHLGSDNFLNGNIGYVCSVEELLKMNKYYLCVDIRYRLDE